MNELIASLQECLDCELARAQALIDQQTEIGAPVGSAGWTLYANQIAACGERCAALKRDITTLRAP